MECELCGKKANGKAFIEGTVVSVCNKCSSFGKKIYEDKPVKLPEKKKESSPEVVYFVQDFSLIIKNAREKKGLTREQLAEKIKEKHSIIERIEKGMRPERSVAEKLEKELGIKIISSNDSEKITINQKGYGSLTLGDIAIVRKKK